MNNTVLDIESKCTACRACEQICPYKAIRMQENDEGFLYPIIDEEKCVNCGLCKNNCHINTELKLNGDIEIYAIKPIERKIAKESTSGGFAQIISNKFIKENGYVYGACYDNDFYVSHVGVNNVKDLQQLKGSKYVISDTKKTYKEVKEKLDDNQKVLYIGTACQISGLKNFLGKDYENLLTVDIVCHGVPSNKLFQKYIKYLENKYKSKIVKYDFRNKEKRPWGLGFCAKVTFDSGKIKYIEADFDKYYTNFLEGNIYRESCYQCKYANINNRVADFTIADSWGIEKFKPDFYDENGVSLVIINSNKGRKNFELMKADIEKVELNLNEATAYNYNLLHPTNRPLIRNHIYKQINEIETNRYISENLIVKRNIKKIIKILIPNEIKLFLKKNMGEKNETN